MKPDYSGLLKDPRWKAKREVVLKRDRKKCRVCGVETGLQVHHKQYHYSRMLDKMLDPWEYPVRFLITLCKSCHERGHTCYRVPVKKVG